MLPEFPRKIPEGVDPLQDFEERAIAQDYCSPTEAKVWKSFIATAIQTLDGEGISFENPALFTVEFAPDPSDPILRHSLKFNLVSQNVTYVTPFEPNVSVENVQAVDRSQYAAVGKELIIRGELPRYITTLSIRRDGQMNLARQLNLHSLLRPKPITHLNPRNQGRLG